MISYIKCVFCISNQIATIKNETQTCHLILSFFFFANVNLLKSGFFAN